MSYKLQVNDCPSANNYLDGVPVKISEKFRPPRKVTLPLSYQQRYPVDLLSDEYDFYLEKQVLELSGTERRAKEALARAKAEKLASTVEDLASSLGKLAGGGGTKTREDDFWTTPAALGNDAARVKIVAKQSDNGSTAAAAAVNRETNESDTTSLRAAVMEPNTMLKPILLESAASAKPDVTIIASEQLNLADFESESSPFDNMALKTLNDMEELKSVLQNVNISHGQLSSFRRSDDANVDAAAAAATISQRANFAPAHGTGNAHVASLSGVDRSLAIHQHPDKSAPIAGQFLAHYDNNAGSFVDAPNLPSPTSALRSEPSLISPSPKCGASESATYAATLVPLQNSRSTPDLLKELGVALAAERERKRLASASSSFSDQHLPTPGNGTLIKDKIFGDDDDDNGDGRVDVTSARSDSVEVDSRDSYPSNGGVEQLVGHIADMGFPRGRVIRAVHKLGGDDKKVVEHLCMVQSFVEAGHSADDAERAIFLHDQNEAAARKYLELASQFKDLGFDEESIQKALLHSNNDRDKALDFLISQ